MDNTRKYDIMDLFDPPQRPKGWVGPPEPEEDLSDHQPGRPQWWEGLPEPDFSDRTPRRPRWWDGPPPEPEPDLSDRPPRRPQWWEEQPEPEPEPKPEPEPEPEPEFDFDIDMANVRDVDTSLWLHNKLGSNEPWTSGSISSQLNVDVLRNIKECFIDLQTQVKLKLLLSFFHIPKRSVDEWRTELEEILEVAQADSEQWVAMLAEILKSFPTTNCLQIDINEPEENRRIFYDLAEDVTKEMKRGKELNLFPMECHYLNKTALGNVSGTQKCIVKHFNMITKPKSLLLRKDLMERASDLARHSAKKIPAPTIPLRTRGMPRKMTDTTPLKGIPSLPAAPRVSQTPALNQPRTQPRPGTEKKGGIKVLDITEQPVGYAQSKRRKKLDAEDKKHSHDDGGLSSGEAPDYAAGLPSSMRPPSPSSVANLVPPPTPASYPAPPTPQPQGLMSPTTPMTPATPFSRRSSIPDGPPPTPTPSYPSKKDKAHQPNHTTPLTTAEKMPLSVVTQTGVTRQPRKTPHRQPQSAPPPPPPPAAPAQQPLTTKTVILQVPTNMPTSFVTLSKELMEKAQEIFKSANRATRPEKEHILKFMAGTRDNPCPELGNIVTIKLSEREEAMQQRDGSLMSLFVETHFQMNYNTGEWKVITKPPKIDHGHGNV